MIHRQPLGHLGLREPRLVKEPIKGNRELNLGLFVFGILEPEVGKNVPGTGLDFKIILLLRWRSQPLS